MKVRPALAAALIGATFASPATAQVSDDFVKIGVLTEMSVQEFGGTVLGKPIQVISADHQHKTDVGATIACRWFDTEGVDVIVDVPNSAVALAVQGLAKEKKRIVLYSGAGTTALTNEQCSPYGFHWTYDTFGVSRGTASAVVKSGGDSWFILASDYAFGHQLQKDATEVVQANGGKVLGAVRHPLNASDFSSFILQAQSSKAKVVGIANAGGDTVNAIRAAREFGLVEGGQNLAALLIFINDIHSLGLNNTQGTYLTTASYWDMNDATRAWSRKFKEQMGAMPS